MDAKNRAEGVLTGIAAGDRNGGPVRMAVRVAESIVENSGRFIRQDVVDRFFRWYQGPPHDIERAFDTGMTFHSVFRHYSQSRDIGAASESVAKSSSPGGNAGINAAHRDSVIAAVQTIADGDIPSVVAEEATITHRHAESVAAAIAVNVIVRALIRGSDDFGSVVASAVSAVPRATDVSYVLANLPRIRDTGIGGLSRGGFAPDVLKAALYFVAESESFHEAIDSSVAFAGSSNYCPVLVGAIAGARWGASSIGPSELSHCSADLLSRVRNVSRSLREGW